MTDGNYSLHITKEQLAAMPVVVFPGRITVVETMSTALKALAYLRDHPVIGFDTETRPSFRKGKVNSMALIQLSTFDNSFLFRINRLGIFDELREFIENPSLHKIGLSLRDDFHVMNRTAAIEPGGFIDLQNVVRNYRIEDISLQKIYGILFGQRISKSQRLSNWEADFLTKQQMMYASIDAWACLRIYDYISSGNFNPDNSPYKVLNQPADEVQ